jgi:transcriptional regulator GlxA family with amidase domain
MRIAIIAYDGISPFMLSTPLAVFGEPFLASGHQVHVCSDIPEVSATGGLTIRTGHGLEHARGADLVLLPGWRHADEAVSSEITTTLRSAAEDGAIVVGLCLGAFGLADAGLLDGRHATTHWSRTAELAARFPRVTVNPKAIFVDEGQVITSAGIAAGLDCCLHILARISGIAEANRIARHLVVAPQRSGAQPQLFDRPAPVSSTEHRVAELLERLRSDPLEVPSLDDLAGQTGLSRRSLTRHIRARTGGNLGGWVRRARLARAQEMLAGKGGRLDQIAASCGFPDAQALRTAFSAELGMTPRQWLVRQRLG